MRRFGIAVATIFACIPATVSAGTMWCAAYIGEISIFPDSGVVTVQFGDIGHLDICNINSNHLSSRGDITPEVCKVMISQALTAKSSGKQILIAVDFGVSAAPVCASGVIGSWATPNPYPYYWAVHP